MTRKSCGIANSDWLSMEVVDKSLLDYFLKNSISLLSPNLNKKQNHERIIRESK